MLRKIKIGDKIPVVLSGRIHQLPVVALPHANNWPSFLKRIFNRNRPEIVTVAISSGKTINCRLFKITH